MSERARDDLIGTDSVAVPSHGVEFVALGQPA